MNDVVALQLLKTSMCTIGCATPNEKAACFFAHAVSELQPKPDLANTSMCKLFQYGLCPGYANGTCNFAHNRRELKSHPALYKTSHCDYFMLHGSCTKGLLCRHAHGIDELRIPSFSRPTTALNTTTASTASASSSIPTQFLSSEFPPCVPVKLVFDVVGLHIMPA
jgi:hypothetical protein